MAVVPLPHPDSTVPERSAPYWLVPVVGARSGPSDSRERGSNDPPARKPIFPQRCSLSRHNRNTCTARAPCLSTGRAPCLRPDVRRPASQTCAEAQPAVSQPRRGTAVLVLEVRREQRARDAAEQLHGTLEGGGLSSARGPLTCKRRVWEG